MYDNVSSINAGSMDLFDSPMDFDDMAFMSLIMTIQESDQALSAKIKNIRALNEERRALTEELSRLTRALEKANDGDQDWVEISKEDAAAMGCGGEPNPSLEDKSDRNLMDMLDACKNLGVFGEALLMITSGVTKEEVTAELNRRGWVSKDQLKDRIEEIRNQLETLNTNSSVQLIDLNRLLNKRNEAVQLTSNIINKSHNTAMMVIGNFK